MRLRLVIGALVAPAWLLLAGCAPLAPAPVDQREQRAEPSPGRAVVVPTVYQVRSGDTLYSIAFRYRLDWREIAAWNRIEEPFLIRPGQELRLSAPPPALAQRPSVESPMPRPAPAPAPSRPTPGPTAPESEPERSPEPEPSAPSRPPAQTPSEAASGGPAPPSGSRRVGGVDWRWPTAGAVTRPFDPAATRRGIGIAGTAGQPVVAAADGQVVYSGTALIGYGELIIIKHSDTMLSAYAHNRVRLVEEGSAVRAGQPIAELGISDRNEELLHFEIRRNGQPVNPLDFLPRR